MSITPICYGDIVRLRFQEYTVGIPCQIDGDINWANVIFSVCSTLFKGHPGVERFEGHTVLLNIVMNDTSRPSPAVA